MRVPRLFILPHIPPQILNWSVPMYTISPKMHTHVILTFSGASKLRKTSQVFAFEMATYLLPTEHSIPPDTQMLCTQASWVLSCVSRRRAGGPKLQWNGPQIH